MSRLSAGVGRSRGDGSESEYAGEPCEGDEGAMGGRGWENWGGGRGTPGGGRIAGTDQRERTTYELPMPWSPDAVRIECREN